MLTFHVNRLSSAAVFSGALVVKTMIFFHGEPPVCLKL